MDLRVKEVAKKKGVSLDELAKLMDITYPSLFRRFNAPKLSTLEEVSKILNCEIAELLPLGQDFVHSYDENGRWQGIVRKPKYAPLLAEIESIKLGLEDIKNGRVFTEEEVEAEMEKILWE